MEIRRIDKEDTPELAKVLSAAYAEPPFSEVWTQERAEVRVGAILCGYCALGLCAVENGSIIGAVLGHADPYADDDMFFVDELFVIPERKRQGVGRKLLAALEDELKQMGIVTIELISILENEQFYSKCGIVRGEVLTLGKKIL